MTVPDIRYYSAKGGAFINSGTYGCAFSPPIDCKKKTIAIPVGSKVVGKIFSSTESFKQELAIVKLIRSFDKNFQFTVPYYGHCQVHQRDFKPTDETHQCSQHIQSKQKTYPQILYQYGGIDLKEYYSKAYSYPIPIYKFLSLFYPLIEGIQKIHDKGYIHADIKPPNILFDPSLPKLYLIDFGLITPLAKMSEEDYLLRHDYPYYPPEFKILYAFKTDPARTQTSVYQSCLKNFNYLNQSQFILWIGSRWPTYTRLMREFIDKSLRGTYAQMEAVFQSQYIHTIDSYGLAMTVVEIIYRMMSSRSIQYTKDMTPTLLESFMTKVLFPMIHPDPAQRMTAKDAMTQYFGFFKPILALPAPLAKAKPAAKAKPVAPAAPPAQAKAKEPAAKVPAAQAKPLPFSQCKTLPMEEIIERLNAFKLDTTGSVTELCERLKDYYLSQYPSDKQLAQCHLSEAKGGVPLIELRKIAKALGYNLLKRAEICAAFKRLHA
jgi:serine/threonine protein kinase